MNWGLESRPALLTGLLEGAQDRRLRPRKVGQWLRSVLLRALVPSQHPGDKSPPQENFSYPAPLPRGVQVGMENSFPGCRESMQETQRSAQPLSLITPSCLFPPTRAQTPPTRAQSPPTVLRPHPSVPRPRPPVPRPRPLCPDPPIRAQTPPTVPRPRPPVPRPYLGSVHPSSPHSCWCHHISGPSRSRRLGLHSGPGGNWGGSGAHLLERDTWGRTKFPSDHSTSATCGSITVSNLAVSALGVSPSALERAQEVSREEVGSRSGVFLLWVPLVGWREAGRASALATQPLCVPTLSLCLSPPSVSCLSRLL